MWLGKNESSWNVVTDGDGGRSIGPFGIDSTTAVWIVDETGLNYRAEDIRAILENEHDLSADMALWYFDYWYEKHLAKVGHEGLAWTRAIKAYRYGYEHKKASQAFEDAANNWVRFFKTITNREK